VVTAVQWTDSPPRAKSFRHEAFLHRGDEELIAGAVRFVRDALEAREPVLLALSYPHLDQLHTELDDDLLGRGDDVLFSDMADLAPNPGRIIAAWQDFLAPHKAAGRAARGVSEPVWLGRGEAERQEGLRQEALLNLAFTAADDFWLLCPYNVEAVAPAVVEEAYRSHPYVLADGVPVANPLHDRRPAHQLDTSLPPVPAGAESFDFGREDLPRLRHLISQWARQCGLRPGRADLLVLAVNELMTNSIEHAGGRGCLTTWQQRDAVVAEIRDSGYISEPLAGRLRPDQEHGMGRGLWLVNQVCDLVEVQSAPTGTTVRVHMAR
jgi:anti-sigma regulatory factor (Ser/Thr protein kinase)